MARYHVSGDGQPRKCTATSPESCPLAQKDENGKVLNHFDSEAEAGRYGEKIVADGVKSAGSLSKNPLDAMARHAPDDAPDDPAVRTALGALAMRGCTLEKREDSRYEITGVDDEAMSGLVSKRGTFVDGAEVNDDDSVSIDITMNGSIPHWGAEGGHAYWGGSDVSLEAHGRLLLSKNDDGEYELVPDNDSSDISDRTSFDPRETVEDFKYGPNNEDLDENDDEGWVEANDEAIRENLSDLSDVDCDSYFGPGTSKWIQGSDGAFEEDDAAEERDFEEPSTSSDKHVRGSVAMNPSTPADVLARMSTDSDDNVRYHVAKNPNTPASALARMSGDPDEYVRRSVAKNPNTPADALARLSADSSADVRHCVAGKSSTPADVLAKLSDDSDEGVRRAVAWNQSTPADVLDKLSDDPDGRTRRSVAMNPSTPASALARMSTDSDYDVRSNVADNPSAPADALTRMSTDPDEMVRQHVAWNQSAPANALDKLSTDSNKWVRYHVARNQNTSPDSLIKMSTDPNGDVRCEVASNPNTPLNVVEKLAHDEDSLVRDVAYRKFAARQQENNR